MTRVLPPPALPNAPGELRQDPLGGGWVAITVGRAARPEAFLADVGTPRGPLGCPFCPGNEHMTPPEVWADRRPGTEPDRPGWRVRVVPNKFPAFAGPLAATSNGGPGLHGAGVAPRSNRGSTGRRRRPGSTRWSSTTPTTRPPWPTWPCRTWRGHGGWRRRLAAHRDRALGAVLVIVNQGRTAGASLEHPHSQVFATAGRPDRIQAELDRLAGDACAACATVAAERDGPGWSARPASCSPSAPGRRRSRSRPWLLPAAHRPRFEEGGADDDTAMATALGDLLRRFRGGRRPGPYNLVLHRPRRGSTTSTGTCTCCPA